MSSRTLLLVLCTFTLIFMSRDLALGQEEGEPLFGPPINKKDAAAADRQKRPAEKKRVGDHARLIDELKRWPSARGYDVAKRLVIAGRAVVPELMAALEDNDWRVRAGSVYALGELKEASAFPILAAKVKDVSNKIAVKIWFDALVKIDSTAGTATLLPFLESSSARVARDAFSSIPKRIDLRFDDALRSLIRHPTDLVRFRALQILSRIDRPLVAEPFLSRLGDRSPRVASYAADALSNFDDPKTHAELQRLARTGLFRASSYALIALTKAEDRTQKRLLPDDAEFVTRLLKLMRVRGGLENAAAAIAASNLARRSSDARLRKAANGLVPFKLIETATSGNLFRDIGSVRKICFEKVAYITGESFGSRGADWRRWWSKNGRTFVAIRELSEVPVAAATRFELEFFRRKGDEIGARHRIVAEGRSSSSLVSSRDLVVPEATMQELRTKIVKYGFFEMPSAGIDPDWSGDVLEIQVRLDRASRRSVFHSAIPEGISTLAAELQDLVDSQQWQHFYDANSDGDRETWRHRHRNLLANLSPEEAAMHNAKLALGAFDRLSTSARRAAVASFRRAGPGFVQSERAGILGLARKEVLEASGTRELLNFFAQMKGAEITERVLEALDLAAAIAGNSDGIVVPGSTGHRATKFLELRPRSERLLALQNQELQLKHAGLRSLGADLAREDVRKIVIGQLTAGTEGQAKILSTLLANRSELRAVYARALLDDIEKNPSEKSIEAIQLVAELGGESVVDRLQHLASQPKIASAARLALANTKSPRATIALMQMLNAESSASGRRKLLALLSESSLTNRAELLGEKIKTTEDLDLAAELIRESGQIFGDDRALILQPLLKSPSPVIRRNTAFKLAALRSGEAAPALINLVVDVALAEEARQALQALTFRPAQGDSPEELQENWRAWWKAEGAKGPDRWFIDALQRDGRRAVDFGPWLRGETKDHRVLSLMLNALESVSWPLRLRAQEILADARGSSIGNVGRDATPEDRSVAQIQWAAWFRNQLQERPR